MKKSRRMCAAAAVLFAFAAAFALTTAVYRMDGESARVIFSDDYQKKCFAFMFWQTATAGRSGAELKCVISGWSFWRQTWRMNSI